MKKLLNKRQQKYLLNDLAIKQNDDEYRLTDFDKIVSLYLDFKKGIKEFGFTVPEIMELLGESKTHKNTSHWRTKVCQTAKDLYSDGFPFGGLKPGQGELMRYGWAGTTEEKEQISYKFKGYMIRQIKASLPYIDEQDDLSKLGNKIVDTYEKQLKLEFDE